MSSKIVKPIGIFDSGMGGVSVLGKMMEVMPEESFVYYGDSRNAPYGVKTVEKVRDYSIEICELLISEGVKAIVVACNTATSAAINDMRDQFDVPIIGMEPALKPAVESVKHQGTIAVMATEMTLREEKFEDLLQQYESSHNILKIPCPKLVELVEAEVLDGQEVESVIEACFEGVKRDEVSAIVLGCTHFVFLKDVIKEMFDNKVVIFDGNDGTTRHLKSILDENQLKATSDLDYEEVKIINSHSMSYVEKSHRLLEISRACK